MTNPAFQSAIELAEAIRNKKISSVELLELFIDRIGKFNSGINAVVATDYEAARKKARGADEAMARGESWGPLHGLPITVKDTYETEGLTTTSGSPDLKNYVPQKNAALVQAVSDAGAIVFGKTNLPLFAMDVQSYNEVYGQTNNPWNPDRVPGGSSGGAAAALATGLTSFEIGSDIGGSIRNPAHFCGVCGHKPSWGIVPLAGHVPPPPGLYPGEYIDTSDIAVGGPLARFPEDLELLLGIMIGPEVPEQKAFRIELPKPRRENLSELKIGLWLDDAACPVDTLVGDQLQNAVDRLSQAGANIVDKKPDIDFKRASDVYTMLLQAATAAGMPPDEYNLLLEMAKTLQPEDTSIMANLVRGATMEHRSWQFISYERTLMRQKWADFFREFDLLLCPVTCVTAFSHDHSELAERILTVNGDVRNYFDALVAWAGVIGAAYLPSTVIPVGVAADGLPVGVQVVGPYLEDFTPIRASKLISEAIGRFVPPPGYD